MILPSPFLAARPVFTAPPPDLPSLPPRAQDSHKGSHGAVAIFGGSAGDLLDTTGARAPTMLGAPALAALAAFRAGAGLVRITAPLPILPAILSLCPSATGQAIPSDSDGYYHPHHAAAALDRALAAASALAIGPGLGTSPPAAAAVLRAISQDHVPVVLDADALNCLKQIPDFLKDFHAPAVLTPHPGEFLRITQALGLASDLGLAASRSAAAQALAQRLGRIVVLKGHHTVVSDGQRTWTNLSDHPALATAGSGDVLTGILAALIAQYVSLEPHRSLAPNPAKPLDLFDAARIAVFVHGAAALAWANASSCSAGLLAHELPDFAMLALQTLRQ